MSDPFRRAGKLIRLGGKWDHLMNKWLEATEASNYGYATKLSLKLDTLFKEIMRI